MISRVGAIIIKKKKLLLVTGYDRSIYWTPGGKILDDENHAEVLKREIKEELGINVTNAQHLVDGKYKDLKANQAGKSHYYLVEYTGQPKPANEVEEFKWFTKAEMMSNKVSKVVRNTILPRLIE